MIVVAGTHSSQTTGYARVMRGLVSGVARRGHDVRVFGIQASGPSRYLDPRIEEFDAYGLERRLGRDEGGFFFSGISRYVDRLRPSVVVLYNDPVVLGRWVENLGECKHRFSLYLYVDLVSKCVDEKHWKTFTHPRVEGIMVMSACWARELRTIPGFHKPTTVVPHAVAVPRMSRREARAKAGLQDLGDSTVFLNMNRNTRRKRLDVYASAAARYLAACPDADVYFLANAHHDESFDLHSVMRRELVACGVPLDRHHALLNRFLVNRTMLTDERVEALTNACDVVVNVSEGEGFGLCAAEGASAGKAVVVSGVGGALDLFSSGTPTAPPSAIVLSPKAQYWLGRDRDDIGGVAEIVSIDDLVEAIRFFMVAENRDEYGRRASALATSWPTWDDIAETVTRCVGLEHDLHELD